MHDPRYRRAAAYFAFCVLVAGLTGVLGGLGDWHAPVLPTAGCLLLEVVAYGVVWPRGTYVLDRPRDPASVAFGAVWGVCEGSLLLSVYVLLARLGASRPVTVAATFALLSALLGGWHALYWDRHVAPEHNDPRWNTRKVLLCHVPNLLATLAHYAAYGSAGWFVTFQAVSLALSARAMRFPRPVRQRLRA